MPMIKLVGFSPDLDPMTPGIMTECSNIIPSRKGFKAWNSPQLAYPALNSACLGAYGAEFLDGTKLIVAGTATKLYTGASGAWTDITHAAGAYGATYRWRFATYGNYIIATDRVDVVQKITSSGVATDLAGSPPKATIVESVNNFVFLMNTDTATNQWWCSGIGDPTTWTPSIATQAANALLTQTPGPITAGHALGSNIVAYKQKSMYLGHYVGPPIIWGFQLISQETGTPSNEAVVVRGDVHVFVGYEDFYVFDGNHPQSLKSPLREFFFEQDLDLAYSQNIIGCWDRTNDVIFWFYPSVNASPPGTLDSWIAWNPITNNWTQGSLTVEAVVLPDMAASAGLTYGGFGAVYTTYIDAALTNIPFNSLAFAGSTNSVMGVFKSDHALYSITGTPGDSYFITGDYGDDERWSYLIRLKPKYSQQPDNGTQDNSATMTNYYRTNLGGPLLTDRTVNYKGLASTRGEGWFNVRRSARFHRFKIASSGAYEIIGIDPILQDRGQY